MILSIVPIIIGSCSCHSPSDVLALGCGRALHTEWRPGDERRGFCPRTSPLFRISLLIPDHDETGCRTVSPVCRSSSEKRPRPAGEVDLTVDKLPCA